MCEDDLIRNDNDNKVTSDQNQRYPSESSQGKYRLRRKGHVKEVIEGLNKKQ